MNKDIEFFIYNYCIDYKIHKNKMDEHFSFTHKLLVRQKYLWRHMLFVPQNACC